MRRGSRWGGRGGGRDPRYRGVTRLSLRRPAAASDGGPQPPPPPRRCPGPGPQPPPHRPRPGPTEGGAGAALRRPAGRLLLHRGPRQPGGAGGGRKGERLRGRRCCRSPCRQPALRRLPCPPGAVRLRTRVLCWVEEL